MVSLIEIPLVYDWCPFFYFPIPSETVGTEVVMLPLEEVRTVVKMICGARIFDGTGVEPIMVNRLIAIDSE